MYVHRLISDRLKRLAAALPVVVVSGARQVGKYHPIEIKAKSMPGRRDTSSIVAFRKQYPGLTIGPGLVMAPTERMMQITEDDYAIPWDAR